MARCPGMTPRNLDSVLVRCPACGREVEIFSDEPRRPCRCGHVVWRQVRPRCAEWCPAAAQCLGGTIDAEDLAARLAELRRDPHARQYVQSIRARVKGTLDDRQVE